MQESPKKEPGALAKLLGVFDDQGGIKTSVSVTIDPTSLAQLGGVLILTFILCLMAWVATNKLLK